MKKRGLGRGLGDLGLSELLSEMNTEVATEPTSSDSKIASSDEAVSNTVSQAIDKAATSAAAAVSSTSKSTTSLSTATTLTSDSQVTDAETQVPNGRFAQINVDKIHPGRYQPRKDFSQDALEELADSIKAQGIIQPIVLRHMNDGYEIIAGERRFRAAKLAGLTNIPAIVRNVPDEAAVAMALIENIQRRDLNAIEEATALQRLLEEFKLTHQEVATAVGKSRAVVTNLLRLLKLNADVKMLLQEGKIEMGHARALLTLEGPQQSKLANIIITRGLSVRNTEMLVKKLHEGENNDKAVRSVSPDIRQRQRSLSESLGVKVAIKHTSSGAGKVVIHYSDIKELDGVLEHIQ